MAFGFGRERERQAPQAPRDGCADEVPGQRVGEDSAVAFVYADGDATGLIEPFEREREFAAREAG